MRQKKNFKFHCRCWSIILRRSAVIHHVLITKFVALGGFGKFSIGKNKNTNFAGLEPAEVDILFRPHILHSLLIALIIRIMIIILMPLILIS